MTESGTILHSYLSYFHVFVAQRIARWTSNPEAAGSNPVEDDLLLKERPFNGEMENIVICRMLEFKTAS